MRSSAVRISDRTQVAEARRAAMEHARSLAWNDVASGEVALIATELATNLAKHARDGAVILNTLQDDQSTFVQVIAVDQGPGIEDTERCFADGFSTAGSPGTGLGAVRRIARSLEIFSTPGQGTVLVAELGERPGRNPGNGEAFAVGGVSIQRTGETVCGDAWDVQMGDAALAVLVVDGLGHGPLAADAARAAIAAFRCSPISDLKGTMTRLHEALKSTRGAAAGLALIDSTARALRYCGVGNIVAAIVENGEKRTLVSHNGTLGHTLGGMAEFTYAWKSGASLVMHSDGVSARWWPDQWPGLWQRVPAIAAGIIYRDWRRERDDATVVVARSA